MAYEMMIGLQVNDSKMYQAYREAMTPLLERLGGGFRYDFIIGETLKSESPQPINRVFTIHFRSKEAMEELFANPEYQAMKRKFYSPAVGATTIMSSYETSTASPS